jgi:hypothetical protein
MKITRLHKASTSPTGIKYKFGIQVPKGIKNATKQDWLQVAIGWSMTKKTSIHALYEWIQSELDFS